MADVYDVISSTLLSMCILYVQYERIMFFCMFFWLNGKAAPIPCSDFSTLQTFLEPHTPILESFPFFYYRQKKVLRMRGFHTQRVREIRKGGGEFDDGGRWNCVKTKCRQPKLFLRTKRSLSLSISHARARASARTQWAQQSYPNCHVFFYCQPTTL